MYILCTKDAGAAITQAEKNAHPKGKPQSQPARFNDNLPPTDDTVGQFNKYYRKKPPNQNDYNKSNQNDGNYNTNNDQNGHNGNTNNNNDQNGHNGRNNNNNNDQNGHNDRNNNNSSWYDPFYYPDEDDEIENEDFTPFSTGSKVLSSFNYVKWLKSHVHEALAATRSKLSSSTLL